MSDRYTLQGLCWLATAGHIDSDRRNGTHLEKIEEKTFIRDETFNYHQKGPSQNLSVDF